MLGKLEFLRLGIAMPGCDVRRALDRFRGLTPFFRGGV
jgi:hypothetical protein